MLAAVQVWSTNPVVLHPHGPVTVGGSLRKKCSICLFYLVTLRWQCKTTRRRLSTNRGRRTMLCEQFTVLLTTMHTHYSNKKPFSLKSLTGGRLFLLKLRHGLTSSLTQYFSNGNCFCPVSEVRCCSTRNTGLALEVRAELADLFHGTLFLLERTPTNCKLWLLQLQYLSVISSRIKWACHRENK